MIFACVITVAFSMIIHVLSNESVNNGKETAVQQRTDPSRVCQEGEITLENNVKHNCSNGQLKAISCIGTSKTAHAELKINDTLAIDDMWFSCHEKDGRIVYKEERHGACLIGDKVVPRGKTIVIGFLIFLCSPSGTQITGCLIDNGNEKIELKIGETAQIAGERRFCSGFLDAGGSNMPSENGAQASSPVSTNATTATGGPCISNGTQYESNQTWVENNFRQICENGQGKIIACVDEDTEVPVGEAKVKSGILHRCVNEGNGVVFKGDICDLGNVKCDGIEGWNSDQVANASGSQPTRAKTESLGVVGTADNNRTVDTARACVASDHVFRLGESWVTNNFKETCHSDGTITIDACVTDSDHEIAIGELLFFDGIHICTARIGGGISYSFHPCGLVVCGPNGSRQRLGTV